MYVSHYRTTNWTLKEASIDCPLFFQSSIKGMLKSCLLYVIRLLTFWFGSLFSAVLSFNMQIQPYQVKNVIFRWQQVHEDQQNSFLRTVFLEWYTNFNNFQWPNRGSVVNNTVSLLQNCYQFIASFIKVMLIVIAEE